VLSPLDDYPAHQIAEPMRYVGTSDRNFYDRYYFNLFDCDGDLFVTAGLGQYPNLGVADAFVAATYGQVQRVLRASRELGEDRMDTTVGPIAVEVLEGLKRLRLRAAAEDSGVELDVTWSPAVPAVLEARHLNRRGGRIMTESARFAQTGFWEGSLRIGDEHFDVQPDRWWGGRDRSWGIRPVGEPEPPGRRRAEGPGGFLWLYMTMQFPDFTILCIIQEDRTGRRSLEQAVRVPAGLGLNEEPEALGRPEHHLSFASGSRRIEHAAITFTPPAGPVLTVDVAPVAASYLSLGTGYGMDTDWRHGMYQGPLVVQHRTFDLSGPDVDHQTYGLVDTLARFELDGATGYGLFENAVLGPNDRYGFGTRG
jgi:hypothetical protein